MSNVFSKNINGTIVTFDSEAKNPLGLMPIAKAVKKTSKTTIKTKEINMLEEGAYVLMKESGETCCFISLPKLDKDFGEPIMAFLIDPHNLDSVDEVEDPYLFDMDLKKYNNTLYYFNYIDPGFSYGDPQMIINKKCIRVISDKQKEKIITLKFLDSMPICH